MGRDEVTLELERLADGAQLIAVAGANGSGNTTVMDKLHPYIGLPRRAALVGPCGFSYDDHVHLPKSLKVLTWAHEGRSHRRFEPCTADQQNQRLSALSGAVLVVGLKVV